MLTGYAANAARVQRKAVLSPSEGALMVKAAVSFLG